MRSTTSVWRARSVASLLALAALVPVTLAAQSRVDWLTLDAASGRSSDGVFTVAGTLGQTDAATAGNCANRIAGGFWPAVLPAESDRVFASGFDEACAP